MFFLQAFGTMGIIFPLVIPTVCKISNCNKGDILQSSAAILASSIFGNGKCCTFEKACLCFTLLFPFLPPFLSPASLSPHSVSPPPSPLPSFPPLPFILLFPLSSSLPFPLPFIPPPFSSSLPLLLQLSLLLLVSVF